MMMNTRKWKRCVKLAVAASVICFIIALLLMYRVNSSDDHIQKAFRNKNKNLEMKTLMLQLLQNGVNGQMVKLKNLTKGTGKIVNHLGDFLAAVKSKGKEKFVKNKNTSVNYNVHIFYYPWYGNPENDGKYLHWNHQFLPHWNDKEAKKWRKGQHEPPQDIGANFYPELGPYSSKDPRVLVKHLKQMVKAGVGVIVVSWYPPSDGDTSDIHPDKLMPSILNTAVTYNIKVAFHIEPYKDRNPTTLRTNIQYILQTYGNHSAFYRHFNKGRGKSLPVFYIYDSYQVKPQQWAQLFKAGGSMSVRNTELDGMYIGLLVEKSHKVDIYKAGFDGFYTYFAADGFSFGSTKKNWLELKEYAKSHSQLFIPSVGPGYIDTNVRPWNGKNTHPRNSGEYYRKSFTAAIETMPQIISITSFNEWHEGTQIEPAVPKSITKFTYLDYGKQGPEFYLTLTRKYVDKFTNQTLIQ